MSKKKSIVGVKVIKGDINRALKKLKRKVNDSAHLLELRERRYYTKPTTVRRKQKQQAIREQQKETILGKIDDGDTTLRFYTKKKKPQPQAKKNTNTDKTDKIVESYGLRMQK
jgi:ribosomal protein S21